jgi:hypothetical protein
MKKAANRPKAVRFGEAPVASANGSFEKPPPTPYSPHITATTNPNPNTAAPAPAAAAAPAFDPALVKAVLESIEHERRGAEKPPLMPEATLKRVIYTLAACCVTMVALPTALTGPFLLMGDMRTGCALDIVTAALLSPIYWLLFAAPSTRAGRMRLPLVPTLIFASIMGLYGTGAGMHLTANRYMIIYYY